MLMGVIVPATAFGLMGMLIMVSLTRRSDRAQAAAGVVPVDERTRTLALASAAVIPFGLGLIWFGYAQWGYRHWPPAANTMPFGGVGDGWAYATLFALGPMAALGGPLAGLVVGRWLTFRGAGPVIAVLTVLATILMQGVLEPVRYVRVFMPWTYFGGPMGADGDPNRYLILTGSPQWYGAYLISLCCLAILLALLHDREHSRRRLGLLTLVVVAIALGLGALAMTMGIQETLVNPLPGPAV